MNQIITHKTRSSVTRLSLSLTVGCLLSVLGTPIASAQDQTEQPVAHEARKNTKEPVFRVNKIINLDPAKAISVSPTKNISTPAVAKPVFSKPAVVKPEPVQPAIADPATSQPVDSATPDHAAGSQRAFPAGIPNMGSAPGNQPGAIIPTSAATAPHPLDEAINVAHTALNDMRANVRDYRAVMVKRERIGDRISAPDIMELKVRCPRDIALTNGTQTKAPFSVYMKFLRPRASAGREVIWVDGGNNGNICVHEGSGLISLKRFNLDPTGWVAMQGNKYPIYEAGLENLIIKLIEKAERDRAAGMCEVVYRDNATISKRPCDLIEVIHHDCRAPYDFHKAQVFIDKELRLPVRYAAYGWPTTPGGEAPLNEEYTYVNIQINTGLTDTDFSPENSAYNYPSR